DPNGETTYTTVAAQRQVTLYDLLRHTSEMVYGGFTPNPELKELYAKANVAWSGVTPAEQLESLAKVPLARQPGTMWEYGMSTDVVGRVVEAVTGATLGRFLDERPVRPLRWKGTPRHVHGGSGHRPRLRRPPRRWSERRAGLGRRVHVGRRRRHRVLDRSQGAARRRPDDSSAARPVAARVQGAVPPARLPGHRRVSPAGRRASS